MSYGSSVFSFLRNGRTIFHSGCYNLCSPQRCVRVPFSSHPHQHLQFMDVVIAVFTNVRRYVIVVWFAFPWASLAAQW